MSLVASTDINEEQASSQDPLVSGRLRILATTDIHMNLRGFDYLTDRVAPDRGLAGLATLIAQARAEASAESRGCLLVDNGDTWQGTPTADYLARSGITGDHPMVACLNALRYDALGLGNHDLDYGIDYTQRIAACLDMPLICSNLAGPDLSPLRGSAILKCVLPGPPGAPDRAIRIGVLSVLPRLTSVWNHQQIKDRAKVADPRACLREAAPALREQGADIVLLLAHMGIETSGRPSENQEILSMDDIAGIDAVVGGHTHQRLPIHDTQASTGPLPAAMPGHAGSDLAVLDLDLIRDVFGRWRVRGHRTALRSNTAQTPDDPEVIRHSAATHARTLAYLEQPLGAIRTDLHNFFCLVQPTDISAFLARAIFAVVRDGLKDGPDRNLPILAAIACTAADDRAGPASFQHLKPGDVLRRHLAGICPFDNQVWALRMTGAELANWLEHSARAYATPSDGADVRLLDADVPGFNADSVFGIDYKIDPAAPVGQRIRSISYRGRRITDADRFILATSQFRATGGGGFATVGPGQIALRSSVTQIDALTQALARNDEAPFCATPWRLAPRHSYSAVFETAPGAMGFLDDIAHLSPKPLGKTPSGFVRLRLTL